MSLSLWGTVHDRFAEHGAVDVADHRDLTWIARWYHPDRFHSGEGLALVSLFWNPSRELASVRTYGVAPFDAAPLAFVLGAHLTAEGLA
jgi:hypothetical protein